MLPPVPDQARTTNDAAADVEPAAPGDAWGRGSALEDRHDVAGRIAEPGDTRTLTTVGRAAGDALCVGLDPLGVVVVLHLDAGADQGVDGLVDVADLQVEDREDRRLVIRLRI